MRQSGLPPHFIPSISPCKRICSMSDFMIGSSPTTHSTSSITLCSGICVAVGFACTVSFSSVILPTVLLALALIPARSSTPIKPPNSLYPLFISLLFRFNSLQLSIFFYCLKHFLMDYNRIFLTQGLYPLAF